MVSADLRRYVSKEKNPGEDGEESWRSLDGSPWVSVKCPINGKNHGFGYLYLRNPPRGRHRNTRSRVGGRGLFSCHQGSELLDSWQDFQSLAQKFEEPHIAGDFFSKVPGHVRFEFSERVVHTKH